MARARAAFPAVPLLLALVGCALAVGVATVFAAPPATYSPADDPWLSRALEDARIERARQLEVRASPEAREQRRRSRTAYAGLGKTEALDLARGVFRRFVEHPLWRPPVPAADERVDRYLDDHKLLLAVEGQERKRLLVSALPLRVRGAGGEKRSVSIEFEDRGAFVAPKNALTDIRLHKRLGDGAELPSSGVAVRPAGTAGDARADATGGRLFWDNIETDTDFLVGLLPDGFQTFHQLRSAESPERLPLRLQLPEGAELRRSEPGGAEVVLGD